MQQLKGSGRFDQDIVGEEHYQDALIRIAGPYSNERRRIHCDAVLYLQPDNPHDRNAIRIEIEGCTVGYISRYQAPTLRQQLQQIGVTDGQRVTVRAIIGGGLIGQRYGVYLDFDVPDEPQVSAQPLQQYSSPTERQPAPQRTAASSSQIASAWANNPPWAQPRQARPPRPWWKFW